MNSARVRFAALACVAFLPLTARGVSRPRITGISHLGFYASHPRRTVAFWENLLGFQSPYQLQRRGKPSITFIKINDHQHIELFHGRPPDGHTYFSHIAFITSNARQMYAYLKSRSVKVPPRWGGGKRGGKGLTGDLNFEVKDPDGHLVEFVQYMPGDWRSRHLHQDMPATRI